jgi:hypothetical protein
MPVPCHLGAPLETRPESGPGMFSWPSGPKDRRDWMTHTFRLVRLDGSPAQPPSFQTTVLVWRPGDTIPLGRRTLQVVQVRAGHGEELPTLVVEDSA